VWKFPDTELFWKNKNAAIIMFMWQWSRFIAQAKEKGITRLMVDISGNGGGSVQLAYNYVRMLFPHLSSDRVCNYYDVPLGRAADAQWNIDMPALDSRLLNQTFLRARFDALMADNASKGHKLWENTWALAFAAHEVSAVQDSVLLQLVDKLQVLKKAPTFELFEELLSMIRNAYPTKDFFAESGMMDPVDGKTFDPLSPDRRREVMKGGHLRNYSALFVASDCIAAFQGENDAAIKSLGESPFTTVRFVGGGFCGSSCDVFTRSAYLLAREQPGFDFKYVTFGGLGGTPEEQKKYLSGTSFPGGAADSTPETGLFQFLKMQLITGYVLAFWLGDHSAIKQLAAYDVAIPSYPIFDGSGQGFPGYTQFAMYYRTLGSRALPGEFLFFPADFALNDFFYGVTDPADLNFSELERMYRAAAKSFQV